VFMLRKMCYTDSVSARMNMKGRKISWMKKGI
jgi:hypothetical protein